ncbi:sigma-54 dependent transcriptional regulator [uncultured Brevundimonas sp.]|uniref:sigma-54-dependent transcriptional regulator n=1 Tax=uncultured Brevundimonas sp. TaxID=213418 RepID=UPI0025D9EA2A|nr:sigma-54 dependent transcriptional regulator [uncultured Brevundimonas sp.]
MTHQSFRVVLVDDDEAFRQALAERLKLAGFLVSAHENAQAALKTIRENFQGVVLTDLRMPGLDGRQLARRLAQLDADLPVIIMTGHGDVAEAVEAIQDGAYDFLTKPFASERLIETLKRALEKRALVLDNRRLAQASENTNDALPLIGDSPAVRHLRNVIAQLADAQVDVLIEGETGVGKEAVARSIHNLGRRRLRPFVAISAGALSESDAPGLLFGHEAGAFPGAIRRREGQFARAHEGTLFLDEIDVASKPMQRLFLRALEEREILPLGASVPIGLDIRVLAATKADPAAAVARGDLAADLYYRLNVVRLRVPPLRERRDDILALFASMVGNASRRMGRSPPTMTNQIRRALIEHDWPGNLRELSNYANAAVLGIQGTMQIADQTQTLADRMGLYEAELIREALVAHNGNIAAVMDALGIARKTLYDKLARHGLAAAAFRTKRL